MCPCPVCLCALAMCRCAHAMCPGPVCLCALAMCSGRRRTECVSDGTWDCPPRTQLVFIGSDRDALAALACSLQAAADACMEGQPGASHAAAVRPCDVPVRPCPA
eukprot:364620-Chlamydomonas_euryale.AAC.16